MNSTLKKEKIVRFFPKIEGLRGYAILFVIMTHWQIESNPFAYWIRWAGVWGISYFFCFEWISDWKYHIK